MSVVIVKSTIPGRIGIKPPHFNGKFGEEMRSKIPGLRWEKGVAYFLEKHRDNALAIYAKFYQSPTVKRRLVFELNRDHEVAIDGQRLIWHSRDNAKLADAQFIDRVHEIDLKPGGSRANPRISGRLVVDVAIRPDAVITPEPMEIIEL